MIFTSSITVEANLFFERLDNHVHYACADFGIVIYFEVVENRFRGENCAVCAEIFKFSFAQVPLKLKFQIHSIPPFCNLNKQSDLSCNTPVKFTYP